MATILDVPATGQFLPAHGTLERGFRVFPMGKCERLTRNSLGELVLHECYTPAWGMGALWGCQKRRLTIMNTITPFTLSLLATTGIAMADRVAMEKPQDPREPEAKVQIAILLDTSNSMDGLISQAKTQLWKTVNTFIDAKKDGSTPFVEVALFEYGNNALDITNQYVRQVLPLSRDLDGVAEKLFELRTNGGDEFCGAVIQAATKQLKWDPSNDVYKAIFVAGNEPFTQGPTDPMIVCKEAYAKDIVVNTIHCGDYTTGVNDGWKSGAALAAGDYLTINSDQVVVAIKCPQDERIGQLNDRLNETYLPFGALGEAKKKTQIAQDALADQEAVSGAKVQRAVSKASLNYHNAGWDLVDAMESVDVAKLDDAALPKVMQGMTADERIAHVKKMKELRNTLQEEILKLNKERSAYEKAERQKLADKKDDTLAEVLVTTVRKQAAGKGYTFTN